MSATALRIVEGSSMDKTKALSAALSQIERQFGKGSVMKLGKNDRSMDIETISSGSLGLDIALGVGGLPRGGGRDLRAGILRQDPAGAAHGGGGPEEGRHLRLHRCRTRARSGLCPQVRGQYRRTPDLAARHRRPVAGNWRAAVASRGGRPAGD